MDCKSYNKTLFEHHHANMSGLSPTMEKRIAWIADNIPDGVESILEVGAGRCHLANLLFDRGYVVAALELSQTPLLGARCWRLQADGSHLPFADDSFDCVLCVEVLEHLEHDLCGATLREMWRVSRSQILITVPNNENLNEALIRCDRCGHVFHAWGHVSHFTKERVRSLYPVEPTRLETSNHRQRRVAGPLLALRQKIFRTYGFDTYVVCPECGNADIAEPTRSLPVKVIDRLDYWLGLEREAGWLMGLFSKPDASARRSEGPA